MEILVDVVLLTFMGATAVAALVIRSLFAVVMLASIYSLLGAAVFVVMDAVDVAFTEAAVGAGISTVLMLATLALTKSWESRPFHAPWLPLLVVGVTAAALFYATPGMPAFGDPEAPAQTHVAPRYLEETPEAIGIPNVVTAVLASYRGFDTLGEVTVIFTAAIAVMVLLGGAGSRPREEEDAPDDEEHRP